ncbi:hypothetical protein CVD28_21835 [Bacillus sp. M6-12]|nr:hypothetical protein CVD28_21835 [Bacillus sp. M6-12]
MLNVSNYSVNRFAILDSSTVKQLIFRLHRRRISFEKNVKIPARIYSYLIQNANLIRMLGVRGPPRPPKHPAPPQNTEHTPPPIPDPNPGPIDDYDDAVPIPKELTSRIQPCKVDIEIES